MVKPAPSLAPEKSHLVSSTLDPVSFIALNGGNALSKVSLLRTWKCLGYTGGMKPLCPSPDELLIQAETATGGKIED